MDPVLLLQRNQPPGRITYSSIKITQVYSGFRKSILTSAAFRRDAGAIEHDLLTIVDIARLTGHSNEALTGHPAVIDAQLVV